MDDNIIGIDEELIYEEIQRKQEALDAGWSRPRKFYIQGREVSYEEYERYQEEDRMADAMLDAEISYYSRDTSTGEEWETDSDGDYTPDWLYDRI